jgi:iron complex outermembrane receptor protein
MFSKTKAALAQFAALTLVAGAGLGLSSPAWSQAAAEEETIEEVVTTGTRKEGVSPTETMSPIDVLTGATFTNQGTFDMTDGFTKVAPSLNTQRFPIADGTAFIRPVTLRNLSPDQTLVLMNGVRRHRSPLVNLQLSPLGTVNTGSQAVDFGSIPSLAIKRVEILRDGASAQYGSDAIAGVINVILNDAPEGISLAVQTGEYFDGDGARTTVAANAGFNLADRGFINVTGEISEADQTSRGVPRFDCPPVIAEVGAENTPFNGLCQRWGDPDVETLKFVVNAGFDINDDIELYGNVTYADNETRSDFFYRTPVLPPEAQVDGRGTLIVDTDGDFLPDDAPQSLVDDINAAGLNPDDYITADANSPSGYVLLNPIAAQFPGGYNPDFGADISDSAVVLGLRGDTAGDWSWNVSGRFAASEADYVLGETINPSLGRLSPVNFKPGKLEQEETGLVVGFVFPVDVGNLASPLNLAFGAEWREEVYTITAGDSASIEVGPTFAQFGVGSDGFQGFPTASAGEFDSASIAAYVDVEADFTDRFSAGAAIRAEDYDEFGDTFDWKLSGRFELTDTAAIRGTVSTGFRAPTPGQVNTLNITTSSDSAGNLIPFGTYPVSNPVALALGSQPLEPEDSTSFSFGAVFSPTDNTSITLDYYNIEIDDRLTILENEIGPAEVQLLEDAGIENAALLLNSTANFFVNGFTSEIQGIDLSISSSFDTGLGSLLLDFRHNWNEQTVKNVTPSTLNASTIFDFENQVPQNRTVITADLDTGRMISGFVRLSWFDEWGDSGGQIAAPDASEAVTYSGEFLLDVEARFRLTDWLYVSVGGENVLDTTPEDDQHFVAELLGVDKSLTSPFGVNGGFWYVRVGADF